MSRTAEFIRSLVFVVAFSVVTTYYASATDLTSNIVKTAGVFFFSVAITWILVKSLKREGRESE